MDYRYYYENEVRPRRSGGGAGRAKAAAVGFAVALALGIGALVAPPSIAPAKARVTMNATDDLRSGREIDCRPVRYSDATIGLFWISCR